MNRILRSLFRTAAVVALGAVVALPAAGQADFTKFVQLGDSLTAGYLDGCWVEYGQKDSYGSIIARQAKSADWQIPAMGTPGLGGSGVGPGKGCMYLTSLAPTFGYRESVLRPLNLNLARPYDNLAVPGFKIADMVDAKSSAQNGNPLTDLVLRGLNGGTTALQQAASLKPTFLTIWIGANDVLGAVTSGTVVDGVTVTTKATFQAKFQTAIDTMKAAQGGVGKGVILTVPPVLRAAFVVTVPPYITSGGKPVLGADGKPVTFLGPRLPDGSPGVAPIPYDAANPDKSSLLTLPASTFIGQGYGIPCAVLDASGAPANDPRRANCNKPLPDSANAAAGLPGVILYPDERWLVKTRIEEYNAVINTVAPAAGYKVYPSQWFFDEAYSHGFDIGGNVYGPGYLTGGLFSYDGLHPTSAGQAILADDLIQWINDNYGTKIERPNLYSYLFNGNSTTGFPVGAGTAISLDEKLAWAADYFAQPEVLESLRSLFPVSLKPASATEAVGGRRR